MRVTRRLYVALTPVGWAFLVTIALWCGVWAIIVI